MKRTRLSRIVPRSGFALGSATHRISQTVMTAMLVTPVLLLGALVEPSRRMCTFGSSKHDIASATVMKFAHEAYVLWAQEHPSRDYPASLGELMEYMNSKDPIDPWGAPYLMLRAKRGILVMSAGEDLAFGTADDIRSDQ